MRASDLGRPFRGVRSTEPLDTWGRARALAVSMPDDQVFSHGTAAVLHGMRLPRRLESAPLHVTSSRDWSPRMAGVIGHRWAAAAETVRIEGMRVVTPATAWVSLGVDLTLDELIIAADGLVCRRNPLCTMHELHDAVAAAAGARGVRRLRRALLETRERTDSPRETELRLVIVRAGLPEPIVNGPIHNRFGALIAHGDLVYPEAKVVLEYDGAHHFDDPRQRRIDVMRLDEIMEEGYRVIRVDNALLAARAVLLGKIRTALLASGQYARL